MAAIQTKAQMEAEEAAEAASSEFNWALHANMSVIRWRMEWQCEQALYCV